MSAQTTLAIIELLLRYGTSTVIGAIRESDVDNPTPEQIKSILITKRTEDYFEETNGT